MFAVRAMHTADEAKGLQRGLLKLSTNTTAQEAVQVQRPNDTELKKLFISPSAFNNMVRWGWINYGGRSLRWFDHQRPNHDDQFQEPRERKQGKKKFVKKDSYRESSR